MNAEQSSANPMSLREELFEPCPWCELGARDTPVRLDHFITARINHVAKALSRSAARLYAERFDLTLAESRIISIVAMRGACSAREILDEVSLDKALISRAIKKLVEKRLLSTWTSTEDRRTSLLKLTKSGADMQRELAPVARERQRALLASLTQDERNALWYALLKLEAKVQALDSEGTP